MKKSPILYYTSNAEIDEIKLGDYPVFGLFAFYAERRYQNR